MSEELKDLEAAVRTGAGYIARRATRASAALRDGVTMSVADLPFPISTTKEHDIVAREVRRMWERLGAGYSPALDAVRESLADYVVAGIAHGYGEWALALSSDRAKPDNAAVLVERAVLSQAKHDLAATREVIRQVAGGAE